jgi:hypothetical protein
MIFLKDNSGEFIFRKKVALLPSTRPTMFVKVFLFRLPFPGVTGKCVHLYKG